MQILDLSINNFRGIKLFNHSFNESKVVCFVGRGDSCKTTILQAISFALCQSRWISVEDKDFYKGDVDNPITIEIVIGNFPNSLFKDICNDDSYGGTYRLMSKVATRQGIRVRYVNMAGKSGPANLAQAINASTKLVMIESPTNPMQVGPLTSLAFI